MKRASNFYDGRWKTTFSPESKDSSKAIGVFKYIPNSAIVEGTFLTETGDSLLNNSHWQLNAEQ